MCRPRARAIPWLQARAKPRLVELGMSRADGKALRIISAEPSDDALSTTITSKFTEVNRSRELTHASSASREFQLTITMLSATGCADGSAALGGMLTSPPAQPCARRQTRVAEKQPASSARQGVGQTVPAHRFRVSGAAPARPVRRVATALSTDALAHQAVGNALHSDCA